MFFEEFEMFTVNLEIEQGQQKSIQTMQAPAMILKAQFVNLMQEVSKINDPVKIKMGIKSLFYDTYEKKMIENEDYVEFMNKAYLDVYNKGGSDGQQSNE